MKRILIALGVTAAMAVAPSVASAGTSSKASPQQARLPVSGFIVQTTTDSRSGRTLYRLGNSGLWME
jgi:hypothetical protein